MNYQEKGKKSHEFEGRSDVVGEGKKEEMGFYFIAYIKEMIKN